MTEVKQEVKQKEEPDPMVYLQQKYPNKFEDLFTIMSFVPDLEWVLLTESKDHQCVVKGKTQEEIDKVLSVCSKEFQEQVSKEHAARKKGEVSAIVVSLHPTQPIWHTVMRA